MKKLQLGVIVLAAALIVTIVSSSLLGAGSLRRPGGAWHQRQDARGPARASAAAKAGLIPAHHASSRGAADAARRASVARRRRLPVTVQLCRRFEHVAAVGADGASVVVRNDNYGGGRECLANVNRRANFAVSVSAPRRAGRGPVAFPNIFYGCSWGICSPATGLPRRLSRLRDPVTSWYTAGRPPGRWDAAYDIWFARRWRTTGQDHGAEIMLWLRASGFGRPAAAHSLMIDGQRWLLKRSIRRLASGGGWPLIIFRMVRPRDDVRRLALMPFFRHVEALGLLRRGWWLTAVEAGFEIWRGGAGLRTTSFWVRL